MKKDQIKFVLITSLMSLMSVSIYGQRMTTVINPIIYSDVPDPDVICVGKDYYMVSTTAHMSPGAPIMHSKDMKHWEIVSYVFDRLNESPFNDLEGGNIYSRGQWAASLRYYKGQFYVFFGTGVHSYIYTSKKAKGPWKLCSRFERYYHDASILFDNDGKTYLIHCENGVIYVKQFTSDLQDFSDGDSNGTKIIHLNDGFLHEGVHAYKINGKYYMTTIWWPGGGIRTELCFRSDNLTGPYEQKVIHSDSGDFANHGVAQGGIWQASNGEWYGMLFQDHEGVGRIPYLLPCRWVDGWPMLGDESGRSPKTFTIPDIKEHEYGGIVKSDDFSSSSLGLTWQWNHNPDNSLWSLKERRGYLRLRTGKIVNHLFEARNTITQRTEGPHCKGIVRMDISNMADGDHTGLFSFCSEPGGIQVVKTSDGYRLEMVDRDRICAQVPYSGKEIWLCMSCDFTTDTATFFYSNDGIKFTQLGGDFHMIFSMAHFTGNKFAIFNYATKQSGGYVDIDNFEYTK
mgnify:CR=1 FL=1